MEAELTRWPSDALSGARRRVDAAILMMRTQPTLEDAVMSEALHGIALTARQLKRGAR